MWHLILIQPAFFCLFVFVVVFSFHETCAPMLSAAYHSDEFHLAEKEDNSLES